MGSRLLNNVDDLKLLEKVLNNFKLK